MSNTIQRRQVANEALKILQEHSPLTINMLQTMIEPPIQKKNLRQAMGILIKKNIVNMTPFNSQTFYYQINQSLPVRKEVAKTIKCEGEEVKQKLLRKQDWYHNQWCEFWTLIIKKNFPEAEIVREHNICSHQVAQNILVQSAEDTDLMPDMLVIFPKKNTGEAVSVAFEIERTRKSNKRIHRKLKKYIYESHLDGLIYVCDNGRLSETIRLLYETKTLEKAHKKKGYAENFFLLSDSISAGNDPLNSFFNAKAKPTSLVDWMDCLRSTSREERRDAAF